MKKLITTLTILCLSLFCLGQIDIEDEIKNYNNSTKTMIENGRRLMMDEIERGDLEKASAVLNHLKKKAQGNHIVLYINEELLATLAMREFEMFLFVAQNIEELSQKWKYYRPYERISERLSRYLKEHSQQIDNDINQSSLSESDKELIMLYKDFYLNRATLELRKKIKLTQLKHGQDYSDFLSNLKRNTMLYRINFDLGYTKQIFSGNITDLMDSNIDCVQFGMDYIINRTLVSIHLQSSVSSLSSKVDIPIKKTDYVYLVNNPIRVHTFGIKLGGIICKTPNIKLIPYVNLSGIGIDASHDDFEADEQKTLFDGFMPGIGIQSEISLFSWKSKYSDFNNRFIYIKPTLEYSTILTGKQQFKGNALQVGFTLGYGLGNF